MMINIFLCCGEEKLCDITMEQFPWFAGNYRNVSMSSAKNAAPRSLSNQLPPIGSIHLSSIPVQWNHNNEDRVLFGLHHGVIHVQGRAVNQGIGMAWVCEGSLTIPHQP